MSGEQVLARAEAVGHLRCGGRVVQHVVDCVTVGVGATLDADGRRYAAPRYTAVLKRALHDGRLQLVGKQCAFIRQRA